MEMLNGYKTVGWSWRKMVIVICPVLMSESVARNDRSGDDVTRTCSMRGWIAAIFGTWRAGAILKQGCVFVDVGGEAVYGRGGWTTSGVKMLLRWRFKRGCIATIRLGRAAMLRTHVQTMRARGSSVKRRRCILFLTSHDDG